VVDGAPASGAVQRQADRRTADCHPRPPNLIPEPAASLAELAARQWRHPVTGKPVRLGVSTVERWYYRARKERHDPVGVLRRKVRTDAGRQAAMGTALREAVLAQYAAHKSWSAKLHHDNLLALTERRPEPRAGAVLFDAAPLPQGVWPR